MIIEFEIELSRGLKTIVDADVYEWASKRNWYAGKSKGGFYAISDEPMINGRRGKKVLLHREVIGAKPGQMVDHINGNPLDNRKANLRFCDHSTNSMNTKRRADNTSGYRGVTWHSRGKKWLAQLVAGGKHYSIGLFSSKEDAARAYNVYALKHHGEFARLNDVRD